MQDRSVAPILSDIIAEIIGSISKDVRQHVVEEPWFGKKVTLDAAADIGRSAPPQIEPDHLSRY